MIVLYFVIKKNLKISFQNGPELTTDFGARIQNQD